MATSTVDFPSQKNMGENSKETWRKRKRENDRNYRNREKAKRLALKDENDRLKQEIQAKDNQEQRMKFHLVEFKDANARLKCELEEKKQLIKFFLDVIGVGKEQQMSLAQIKLVVDRFASMAELQQNTTQPLGTCVYARPWQRQQQNILINQGSQASAATLPLTQLAGTNRMQQTFQCPGTFTWDSHGLPDFLLQEKLGQTAHTINLSQQLGLHQGQGGNTAVELQPFTQGLSDQDADMDEFFSSYQAEGISRSLSNADRVEQKGQGGSTAVELQPFTQGLSDQDADMDEFFSSYQAGSVSLSLSSADRVEQGGSTAVELQPFTQGLLDQDADMDEFFSSLFHQAEGISLSLSNADRVEEEGQGGSTTVKLQPFTQGLSDQDADMDEFFSSLFYQAEGISLSLSNADRVEREAYLPPKRGKIKVQLFKVVCRSIVTITSMVRKMEQRKGK